MRGSWTRAGWVSDVSAWVGVIVFGGRDDRDYDLVPLTYTSGAHDSVDAAMGAGMMKAAQIMRMSALVTSDADELDALVSAAGNVAQYGAAHWSARGGTRDVSVRVCELTDGVSLG